MNNRVTKIYLITNCFEDPNKIYIGKEKSHKSRSRYIDHKKTYGDKIIFSYIDEIEGWEIKDWKPLECFWIEYFRHLGFDIQNKNKGGCGPSFQTNLTKQRISKSSKYKNSKYVIQYDLEGNFIKEWRSFTLIKHELGFNITSISYCCRNITNTAYNYIWKYKTDKTPIIFKKRKIDKKGKVLQLDKNQNIINIWNNGLEASEKLIIPYTSINNCLRNKQNTSGGFVWKYKQV